LFCFLGVFFSSSIFACLLGFVCYLFSLNGDDSFVDESTTTAATIQA
jgi:hypothetical protein